MSDRSNDKTDSDATEEAHGAEQGAEAPANAKNGEAKKPADPVFRLTRAVLIVIAVLFVWYVISDRFTPYTNQARVQAYVVPLVARVSGEIKQADLEINQLVEADELLIKIDSTNYDLALAAAEADLERARQDLLAGTSGLATIEARLRQAKARRQQAQDDFDRIESIYRADPGATSEAARTRVRTALAAANQQVRAAEADLERAREQLAAQGDETPEIRRAIAAVHRAKVDVKYTKIKAPDRGVVVNMKVEEGMYTKAGSVLGNFVPFERVWVQANFRENSLGNVSVGDPVEILLDLAPGKVFEGRIASLGYAVGQGTDPMRGTLTSPKKSGGWLRDAQYFPVIVEFDDVEAAKPYRIVGGQADVVIYTGDGFILNTLAKLWIRILSFLSYVY